MSKGADTGFGDKQVESESGQVPDSGIWGEIEIRIPARKKHISIRLDEDVLFWFQAQGRGYQGRINAVLRSYMNWQMKATK